MIFCKRECGVRQPPELRLVQSAVPPNPDTGWRRCIGCLKLQVSFRKRATSYRALLREMTYNDGHPMGLCHPVHDNVCVCVRACERESERARDEDVV